jgi:hypothetical protein
MGLSEGIAFNREVDRVGRAIYDDFCDIAKDKAVACGRWKERRGERLQK